MTERNLSRYLKELRGDMTLREVEELTGVSYSYLSAIERGYDSRSKKPVSPTLEVIIKIAKGFGIPLGVFLNNAGFAENDYIGHGSPASALKSKEDLSKVLLTFVSMYGSDEKNASEIDAINEFATAWWDKHKPPVDKGFYPIRQVPIIGSICAGMPMFAEQNIIGYMPTPTECKDSECFYLQVNGDSMEPTLANGSLVLVKHSPNFSNGDICAVMIDDEATLKRVYKNDGKIELVPDNPKYPRMVYTNGNIRVIGTVLHEIRYYNTKA